jgi:hypothetical protein
MVTGSPDGSLDVTARPDRGHVAGEAEGLGRRHAVLIGMVHRHVPLVTLCRHCRRGLLGIRLRKHELRLPYPGRVGLGGRRMDAEDESE